MKMDTCTEKIAQMQSLLIETLMTICSSGMAFRSSIKIEGLIAVTVEDMAENADIILMNVNRTFFSPIEKAASASVDMLKNLLSQTINNIIGGSFPSQKSILIQGLLAITLDGVNIILLEHKEKRRNETDVPDTTSLTVPGPSQPAASDVIALDSDDDADPLPVIVSVQGVGAAHWDVRANESTSSDHSSLVTSTEDSVQVPVPSQEVSNPTGNQDANIVEPVLAQHYQPEDTMDTCSATGVNQSANMEPVEPTSGPIPSNSQMAMDIRPIKVKPNTKQGDQPSITISDDEDDAGETRPTVYWDNAESMDDAMPGPVSIVVAGAAASAPTPDVSVGNTCQKCGGTFGTAALLQMHRNLCYRIKDLGKIAETAKAQTEATKASSPSSPDKDVTSENQPRKIMEDVDEQEEYICSACEREETSIASFVKHLTTSHKNTKSKKFMCPIHECDGTFQKATLLVVHIRLTHLVPDTVSDSSQFRCNLCQKSFQHYNQLFQHQKKCKSTEEPGSADTESQEKFSCELCLRSFTKKQYLNMHVKWCNKKNISCHRCKKSFQSKADLIKHNVRLHKNKTEPPASQWKNCPDCPEKFWTKVALQEHLSNHHLDQDNSDKESTASQKSASQKAKNNCQYCKRSFKTQKGLDMHVSKMHGESKCPKSPKRFKCKECGKTFRLGSSLKGHLCGVQKESPAARAKPKDSAMEEHIAITQGTYVCLQCDRGFESSNQLREHIKVHLKE